MSWQERAACATPEIDPEMFFPDPSDRHGTSQAKAVCATCPVVDRCGAAADDAEGDVSPSRRWGVWGGRDTFERCAERRGVEHGTLSAWQAGCQCDGCHDAHEQSVAAWVRAGSAS